MGGTFQSSPSNKSELEEGAAFTPRFDADGLIPRHYHRCGGRRGLDVRRSLATNYRNRRSAFLGPVAEIVWRKGETSGNRLLVQDLLTDCDQDVIWVKARLSGEAACGQAELFL